MASSVRWRGGNRPTGKCARGHDLTEDNLVKAGKGNNPRCKICRAKINSESRKRARKKKGRKAK